MRAQAAKRLSVFPGRPSLAAVAYHHHDHYPQVVAGHLAKAAIARLDPKIRGTAPELD